MTSQTFPAFANTQQWELQFLTSHIKAFCDELRINQQCIDTVLNDLSNFSNKIKRSIPKKNHSEFTIQFMQQLNKQIIQSSIDIQQFVFKKVDELSKLTQIIKHYRTNLQSMCVTAIKNNLYAQKRKYQLEESKKSVDLKLDEIKYKIENARIMTNKKSIENNKLLLTKTLRKRQDESQFLAEEIKFLESQRFTIRQELKINTLCSENRISKTLAYFNASLKAAKSNILKAFHKKNEPQLQFCKVLDNDLAESVQIDCIEPIPEIQSQQDIMEQYQRIEKKLLTNIEGLNLGPQSKNFDLKKIEQAIVTITNQVTDKKNFKDGWKDKEEQKKV